MTVLVRFRANPQRVRVSVGRDGDAWRATVESRESDLRAVARDADPAHAIDEALSVADAAAFPGVDIHMQWAYTHPWKRAIETELSPSSPYRERKTRR